MNYVFTRAPLDEECLEELSAALQQRTEFVSRQRYPALWEQADRAAAKQTPESAAKQNKAAAVRKKLWGALLCVLGVILLVPGLMKPAELTVLLVVGIFAVLQGLSRLLMKYVSHEEKQKQRHDMSAHILRRDLNRAQSTGEPRIVFSDDAMTMTSPSGQQEIVPYTDFEVVIEGTSLFLITFRARMTVIRHSEIVDGDIAQFREQIREKAAFVSLTET